MHHIKLILVTLFVLIALSGCDQKDETRVEASISKLDLIIDSGVLRVGTTGDYLPFSYVNPAFPEPYSGIDVAFAKELANSLSVEVAFVQTSWPSLMDDLMADRFDIGMSGITITEDRKKIAMFSVPMHSGGKAAISKDEDARRFDTIDKINQQGVRVIFNPGGTNESFARKNFSNAMLIENENNLTVFDKIISGDADVMVTDAIETIIQEKIHSELQAVNPDRPFNSSQKAYLIQNDKKFKTYIDEWITNLRQSGKFEVIFNGQLEQAILEE